MIYSIGPFNTKLDLFAFIIIKIFIYLISSVFLYKLNKRMYGKKTILAFIPLCKEYLLGKLSFGKCYGIIMIILEILQIDIVNYTNNNLTHIEFLPKNLSIIIDIIYLFLILISYIEAINKFKSNKTEYYDE